MATAPSTRAEGGQFPERETVNWVFRIATALAQEFLTRGRPRMERQRSTTCIPPCVSVRMGNGVSLGAEQLWRQSRHSGHRSIRLDEREPARLVRCSEDRSCRRRTPGAPARHRGSAGMDRLQPSGALQYLGLSGTGGRESQMAVDIRGPRWPTGWHERWCRGQRLDSGSRRCRARRPACHPIGVAGLAEQGTPPPSNRYLTQSGAQIPAIAVRHRYSRPCGSRTSTVPGPPGPPGVTYAAGTRDTADLTVGSTFVDGASVQKDVDNTSAVEVRDQCMITTSAGRLRVIRDSTTIVDAFAIDCGRESVRVRRLRCDGRIGASHLQVPGAERRDAEKGFVYRGGRAELGSTQFLA